MELRSSGLCGKCLYPRSLSPAQDLYSSHHSNLSPRTSVCLLLFIWPCCPLPGLLQAATQQFLRYVCVCLSAGKILVHCAVGVSRSATLVLAYLMLYHHFTLVEAIKKVKDHRGIIPNRGFLRQLLALDRRLRQGLEA